MTQLTTHGAGAGRLTEVWRCCLAAALIVLSACAGSQTRELAVPDVRQATDYTCSASALQAVLAYYGIEMREGALAR